jgi:hypothetical protein
MRFILEKQNYNKMEVNELIEILDSGDYPSYTKKQDNEVAGINLLRDRIPYEKCKNILVAAEHDIIYLVSIEDAAPYLTKEDAIALVDFNIGYNEDAECLYIPM